MEYCRKLPFLMAVLSCFAIAACGWYIIARAVWRYVRSRFPMTALSLLIAALFAWLVRVHYEVS